MKKLLGIVVLGLLLNSCSKESQEVTLICDGPSSIIVNVSNGKMCFIDPLGKEESICAELEVNNSKTIRTKSLHKSTSALARELQTGKNNKEFYIKIDRTIGTLGFFYTADDVNVSDENKVVPCKKKEKL